MNFDFTKEPGRIQKRKNWTKEETKRQPALVTIVTPFYNAGKYLAQTYRCVINQTFPWFEWLIVNDGSSGQEDLHLLRKLAGQDARITVLQKENGGPASARNLGVKKARTQIIIPLDADDLIEPQYLEYVFFGLYFHPEAAWCYTDSVGFGQQEYLWKYPWDAGKMKKNNFLTVTAAIRKPAFVQAGGYPLEKGIYEDWQLWLRLLADHQYPVHLKGYLFWYRRLSDGVFSKISLDERERKKSDGKRKNEKAAKAADERIRAVEYPILRSAVPYHRPEDLDVPEYYTVSDIHTKTRILMLVPWLVMGGADKFNLDLVSGLDRQKYEISILTTVSSEHEWQAYFAEYTDEIFHLPDFLDPAHYVEYVSFHIRTRKIDILFLSNSYLGYYMLPFLRKQFPDLCMIDYVHMEEWYWRAGGFARLSGMFGSLTEKTYVCSSAAKKVLIEKFQRDSAGIVTMYIGVDEEKFDAADIRPGRLYRKLGIENTRPVVLFPCRITHQKRPFLMLAVAKAVSRKIPEVIFAVVGDGPQSNELKREVKRYGLGNTVICTGPSDHMAECYRDAKLTLICSIKEGLSLTAYESLAMGTPVVSSDVGGQKDLIDDTVGKLIPMRQSEADDFERKRYSKKEVYDYAEAIIRLLSDQKLYETCSRNCREKIMYGFTTRHMLEQMEREMEELMADEERSQKRREQSVQLKKFGYLAQEVYTAGLAQEERSMASSALLGYLEKMTDVVLPKGSRRREEAAGLYKRWKSL